MSSRALMATLFWSCKNRCIRYMSVPWPGPRGHGIAMPVPWQCHGSAMAMPKHCLFANCTKCIRTVWDGVRKLYEVCTTSVKICELNDPEGPHDNPQVNLEPTVVDEVRTGTYRQVCICLFNTLESQRKSLDPSLPPSP